MSKRPCRRVSGFTSVREIPKSLFIWKSIQMQATKHNITKDSVFIVIFSIQFSSVGPLPRFPQDSLYLKQWLFLDRWLPVTHATGLKGIIYHSVLEFLSVPSHTFMGKNSLISFFFVEYFSNH